MRRLSWILAGLSLLALLVWTRHAALTERENGYVVLGDSYASGVGAAPYQDGLCRQSLAGSYPQRWAASRAKRFDFVVDRSCSGATTATVTRDQLTGLDKDTGWVTVTVGGNDIGFNSAVVTCATKDFPACLSAVRTSTAKMRSDLPGALDQLFTRIREDAPRARVVVVGYPHLVTSSAADCGLLDAGKRASLNSGSDVLAGILHAASDHRNFPFVDGRPIFEGHEICSPSPWIHPFSATGGASFHPTPAGYEAYGNTLSTMNREDHQ